MATAVVMPKQGQSVESCIIVGWKKEIGEEVAEGEVLCEVETDKALLEVPSSTSGTLLARFFEAGDDVPVLTPIAVIGRPGEDISSFRPGGVTAEAKTVEPPASTSAETKAISAGSATTPPEAQAGAFVAVSPRARSLAARKELDISHIQGSGSGGRIIERDIQAALERRPIMTPLAKTMVAQGGFTAPERGSGVRGRIMAEDLDMVTPQPAAPPATAEVEEVETIPLKGARKVIAARMLESLQTTAQLTLNASADARALLAYRERLKQSQEGLGLQKVTLNDLLLLAVSRLLLHYPDLNAHFTAKAISRYKSVHLGFAVDTPRGLMVPVIRRANILSLKQISQEARRLATACLENSISPDELSGGTFTVTNLGNLGIESFTPILNPPQVAILGVGNIGLKPVEVNGQVQFIPHISLSLTINHQAVDGAPAARFLQAVCQGLAEISLLLAL
jgi:pyruvate dehydrogenase E2 component (dihydrolipoamide acetyltransferase)